MKKIEMNPIESVLKTIQAHFTGCYKEIETVEIGRAHV